MSSNPNVNSIASFTSSPFDYDELYASETVSQSADIAGGTGILKRGTVLFGPLAGVPITGSTALTTVPGALAARCILAADVDISKGDVTGLVYTQGKFLDSGMIFSSQGAAKDAAQLWQFGIYVLTVMNRSGLLIPMTQLPATGGALPKAELGPEEAKAALEAEAKHIRDAQPDQHGDPVLRYRRHPGDREPAYAKVAFENAVHEEPQPVDPHAVGYRPPPPPLHGSGPHDLHTGHAEGHVEEKTGQAHDVSKHSDHESKSVDQPKKK